MRRVPPSFALVRGDHALNFEVSGAIVPFGYAVGFDAEAIVLYLQGSGIVKPQLNSGSVAVQNDGINQGWTRVIGGIAIDQTCQHRPFAIAVGVPGRGSLKVRNGFSKFEIAPQLAGITGRELRLFRMPIDMRCCRRW